MNKLTLAATTAALLGCGMASAQSLPPASAFYIVGGAGVAQHDINGGGISGQLVDLGYLGATTSVSNDETAWRIGAGWIAHPNLGIEVSYFDLGKPGYTSTATRPGSFDASIAVTGWSIDLVPQYQFGNNIGVFGRLGYARTESDANFSGSGAFRLGQSSANKTRNNWDAGLGVSYAFTRNLSVRGEWTYYPDLGDDTMGGQWDANVFTLSAVWRF
jgi:OOP family OmpA-OmpF porin